MTYFHTCKTCRVGKADCDVRAKLEAAIAGLGIGSLKHRCAPYAPLYTPGAPVLVQTVAWMSRDGNGDDEGEPPKHWYPGHFIRFTKASVVAFIKPGTDPVDVTGAHSCPFETQRQGFVKVPLYRVRPSDWAAPVSVEECTNCGAITALGQPCGRDVNYHSLPKCQAHRSAAMAEAAEMLDGPPCELSPIEVDEHEWVF